VKLPSGEPITAELVSRLEDEELAGSPGRYDEARRLFERVALSDDFPDFLTTVAYESID
jgi:malate synthase